MKLIELEYVGGAFKVKGDVFEEVRENLICDAGYVVPVICDVGDREYEETCKVVKQGITFMITEEEFEERCM